MLHSFVRDGTCNAAYRLSVAEARQKLRQSVLCQQFESEVPLQFMGWGGERRGGQGPGHVSTLWPSLPFLVTKRSPWKLRLGNPLPSRRVCLSGPEQPYALRPTPYAEEKMRHFQRAEATCREVAPVTDFPCPAMPFPALTYSPSTFMWQKKKQ